MKQIEAQLSRLRLTGMNKGWKSIIETRRVQELSFTDGLQLLLQAEEEERSVKRFERLRTNARFRYQSSIEELHFDATRGLSKDLITCLATCDYITKGESVLITGATGCGKSFIASALGHHACLHGKTVGYYNTQKLLMRIKMARLEGTIRGCPRAPRNQDGDPAWRGHRDAVEPTAATRASSCRVRAAPSWMAST